MKFVVSFMLAAASLCAAPDFVKSGAWMYQFDQDGMGRTQQTVWTYSTNHLNFGFPYQGTQSGKLALRTVGRNQDIMLSIEHGQFNCGVAIGCIVNVRFDEGKIQRYCGSWPSDGSSDVIFLSAKSAVGVYEPECNNIFYGKSFVAELRKAKRVRIEAEFYREGMQTLDFNVEGLK